MGTCRSIRPLLAAALYEPLSTADQGILDAHLAVCARCRAERAAFERVTETIPRTEHRLDIDLAPRLRARLMDARQEQPRWTWRPIWATATVTAAVFMAVAGFVTLNPGENAGVTTNIADNSPAVEPAPPVLTTASAEAGPLSPIDLALDESEALIARHAYTDALVVLQDALRLFPGDSAAGQAQLRLADLEFRQLRRYPQAFDAYVKLRNQFPDTFAEDHRNVERFDLLVEGWQDSFDDLYALDAARSGGEEAFPQFEEILAQNPGKLIAMLAMEEMKRCLNPAISDIPGSDVVALEELQNRCKNPVAVAQVCLALGDAYAGRVEDRSRARNLYETVLNSGVDTLAGQAREALARLESR